MVPKVFDPLKFYCIALVCFDLCSRQHPGIFNESLYEIIKVSPERKREITLNALDLDVPEAEFSEILVIG